MAHMARALLKFSGTRYLGLISMSKASEISDTRVTMLKDVSPFPFDRAVCVL